MTNLFEAAGLEKGAPRPLADRLRPQKLSDVTGQDHIVGPEGTLTRMLKSGRVPSLILWGPPGCGKTTIARLLAGETNLAFEQLSAIFSGVAELRKSFDRAKIMREQGKGTLLFIDEIHRFNRGQQDSFLPHMEDGTITLEHIKDIKAEGKTTGELQREIHDAYVPTFYKRLTVTVKTDRLLYYVQGQVRQSGRQEYLGATSVLKAIASAGDFTDFAKRRDVVVTRKDGTVLHVNCVKAAKNPALDIPIFPGDKILVQPRGPFEPW